MEVKNLKYNPPENYPGHNTNLDDDNLLPYKVFIKYTTNLTGDKDFYLTPDNLNVDFLTPATQELAIGENVVLLKEKLPGELIALTNNVSGLKYKSYKNEYLPLIKKIKESIESKKLSESEQKFKNYVQSNPYFEYNQIQCVVENKQSGKRKEEGNEGKIKSLYNLKSTNGDLFNVNSKLNNDGKMIFEFIKPNQDTNDSGFKPVYHENNQIILINLTSEFKKNIDSVDMPSGKKNVNYLLIYGPPPYDVKYDATDYDEVEGSSKKNKQYDLKNNWHVTTTTKRVKVLGKRLEGYRFVKSNIPTYSDLSQI